jgi:hypothetical protein
MVIKSSDNTDGIPNINKTNLGVISYIQNKANLDNMGQLGQPNDNKEQYKICK